MEPEAKYTLVGSAVLILLALLAAAVVWLKSTGEGANARQFKIYFERQSLEGLEPRSAVTMRGMRVGSVTGFRFSSRRPGAVEVTIAVEPTTPVRESTRATIDRHLVTGLASVQLANLTEESPPLNEAPGGEPYPVIAEGESPIEQVSETLTRLAQRANETMTRLNSALSPENVEALSETLASLRRLTRQAGDALARADATFGSVEQAAGRVGTLADSVARDARRLADRYDKLGSEAGATAREISEAVGAMRGEVERLAQRAEALLARGDEELGATAQALRSAADSLARTADRLREPRQAIFGPAEGGLGPGEGAR